MTDKMIAVPKELLEELRECAELCADDVRAHYLGEDSAEDHFRHLGRACDALLREAPQPAEQKAPPALVQAPKKPKIGAEQERLIQVARTKLANYKGMSAEEREAYEWYRDRLMPVRIQVLNGTLDEDELSSEEKEEVLTWREDFRDLFRDGLEAEWLKTQE